MHKKSLLFKYRPNTGVQLRGNCNSRKMGTRVGTDNGNENSQKLLLFNLFFTGETHRIIRISLAISTL